VPIEVKSTNTKSIPKIFYSFEKDYWNKISFYVRTTKDIFNISTIWDKKIYFLPNFLIGKIFVVTKF
jgi:hypothetical protein